MGHPVPHLVDLRRIREEDWATYRALRLQMLQESPLAFASPDESRRDLPDSWWQDRTSEGARSPEEAMWIATVEGVAVDMVAVSRRTPEVRIFSMWVHPEHRGNGIGGRLLHMALAWAQGQGPRIPVLLDVHPRQRAALHMYRKKGFRLTGKQEPLPHTRGEVAVEMRWMP